MLHDASCPTTVGKPEHWASLWLSNHLGRDERSVELRGTSVHLPRAPLPGESNSILPEVTSCNCWKVDCSSGILNRVAPPNFDERLRALASGQFEHLRPAQKHILDRFTHIEHSSQPDIGIELPTGEGKTLIALLIADWALDEGMSVAYLTGTKQLAKQVQGEAATLQKLDVHRFESGNYPGAKVDDYHQAQAVGVMNYWVYFNSQPKIEPADLVIFDDAHLAEQPLAGLFTLRVPRSPGAARHFTSNFAILFCNTQQMPTQP